MTSTSTTAKRRFSFRRKAASPLADGHHKKTFWQRVYRDRYLLLLFLPCLIYYILFKYVPMWGVLISFKDFKPFIGFMGSDWVGLKHYVNFFSNPDAWRIIRNTLFLGVYSLVWCFPFPIIFALALNEVTRTRFKKFVQTISYMPHFLSAVVVCGMLVSFLSPIGENGHIAFNDPPVAEFDDPAAVKVVALDEVCRNQQVHDGCFADIGQVPTHALTLTVPTLAGAKHHLCIVPAPTKAKAVRDTLEGPVSTACPASILRTCPGAVLYLERESAQLLTEV